MIKNILLDLDDTILDFKKCEHVALDKALTVLGVETYEEMLSNQYFFVAGAVELLENLKRQI